jgi:HlyD family secretion protein
VSGRTVGQKKFPVLWLVVACVLVAAAAAVWFMLRPKQVAVTHPRLVPLTETIASSARVGGVQESAVGSQFTGTVEHLFVRIGDRVTPGQAIATLRNDVTQQQRTQAKAAVATAQARLAQVAKPPQKSELDEAIHGVTEAKAQAKQAATDLTLATTQFDRQQKLYDQKLISRSEFDSGQSNQKSAQARLKSAKATVKVREAKLETLRNGATSEDVQVARAQLTEAQQALQVADQQSKEAIVKAPFAGVITALNAQEGQTVGANGVVNLVSDDLEIRVDLDESNLADLEVGQAAVLSSSAFGGKSFDGKLTDIGAAVDEARGIVTVKITPIDPPSWLRPGQTINVNLVTNEKVDRLLVPVTAVQRQGTRSVVMVVEDGHVAEKVVLTRPTVQQGIPIVSGLTDSDQVIADASGVKVGQQVRVRGS